MRLPEGWSEAEVLRCAAGILEREGYDTSQLVAWGLAEVLDARSKLAASVVPDDQGEKEAGGDS